MNEWMGHSGKTKGWGRVDSLTWGPNYIQALVCYSLGI